MVEIQCHSDQNKQSVTENVVEATNSPIPDQFDERYRTTKWEVWAYYVCVEINL